MPIGSIIGGLIGAGGANAAGNAAGNAGNTAWNNSTWAADQARAAVSPWRGSGIAATGKLDALLGLGRLTSDGRGNYGVDETNPQLDQTNAFNAFQTTPGYQFRLDQGIKALDRTAASRGLILSGAQAKGVNDYAQGQASGEYGNYVNALTGLSGSGLGAATSANNTVAGLLNNGNALQFQGNLGQANSYQNAANALGSGISNGINNLVAIGAYGMGGGFGGRGGGATNPFSSGIMSTGAGLGSY